MTRCSCSVVGCTNTTYKQETQHFKYFRLPADPLTARRWMRLMGRPDGKTSTVYYVCEEHFPAEAFVPGSKKLFKNTLPSVNLPASTVEDTEMVHKSTQCRSQDLSIKPPKREIISIKNHRQMFYALCDKYLERDVASIVKAQTDLKHVFSDHKHELGFKYFCLKFYYTSPASYLALKSYLGLPDKKLLGKLLLTAVTEEHLKLGTTFKAKVDCMSDLEKNCSVLIGFMNVKPHLFYHIKEDRIFGFVDKNGEQSPEPSDNAIVIFARGIYEPWVLAVDLALLPSDDYAQRQSISAWAISNIKMLQHAGLKVRICISNLSPDTIASTLGKSKAPLNTIKPFFEVDENTKIYYMTDPTYIIQKIYKCFKEFEFHTSHGDVAKWKDIVDFYEIDSKLKLRLAPKLSEEHVRACPDTGASYSSMLDTFSEAVAAGMAACVQFGALNASASGTVRFLTIMNNLLDFTHSCNTRHHRPFKRPFEGSESQINSIIEALVYFQNLKLVKNDEVVMTQNLEFIKDFQMAIKALLMLSEDLKIENYPNLFTRNINYNVITNFINSVKRKHKTEEILPWRLTQLFRKVFSQTILQTPKYRSCPEVLNGVFFEYLSSLGFVDTCRENLTTSQKSFKSSSIKYPVVMADYKNIVLPKTDQMQAIGVFVLNKCLKTHVQCTIEKLRRKTHQIAYSDIVQERYPQYKYDSVRKAFIPDAYFMSFIMALENDLKTSLDSMFLNHYFLAALERRSKSTADSFMSPCPCFPTSYLQKLFFRLRLRILLKMNNVTYKNRKLSFSYKCLP